MTRDDRAGPAPPADSGIDHVKRQLGHRYSVERELGHGATASVYLATDLKHERKVALKVLRPEIATNVGAARFLREIRTTATLTHPHIVPLHDSGEAGGLLYYVMPYVAGESLKERLERENQLPLDEAVRIAVEVGEALHTAHEQGIVHRDVKPANILLSRGGPMVGDFGIALAVGPAGAGRLTGSGLSVGTPHYMSPEQIAGDQPVGPATDVYALGCVIYEMLAGEPPFTGPNAQVVVARHLSASPPSLDIIRPGLPQAVGRAVTKALAKSPADRFRSVAEFVVALQKSDTTLGSDPWTLRRRLAGAAVGVLAAVLLGLWYARPPPAPPLDTDRILVLPLGSTIPGSDALAGWDVALAIGGALEHTEPLRFLDAWPYLGEEARADPVSVTVGEASALARQRGAAWIMSGVIRETADSLAVRLSLYEASGESVAAQATEIGPRVTATAHALGIAAVRRILPRLVAPGHEIDFTPLTDRTPASVALWLQGERAYRQARFGEAREFYARAVAEDSLYAFAAIKGAQAASWSNRFDEAQHFIGVALANDSLLPDKYRSLAAGLSAYFEGSATEAIRLLSEAVGQDREWSEAAMALGDVYYHLLPPDAFSPDSVARFWFERARVDTLFAPPLYHLSEIALRDGDTVAARRSIERWRRFNPDTILLHQVEASLACVSRGSQRFDWSEGVEDRVRSVLQAGISLAGGASQVDCARSAFLAIFDGEFPTSVRWTALKGLHGLAMAEGRYVLADSLLRVDLDAGLSAGRTLWVYADLAGGPFEEDAASAESLLRSATDSLYTGTVPRWRWLMGAWLARRGEWEWVQRLAEDMGRHADEVEDREERLLARALRAHSALGQGDTAQAIAMLRRLTPDGPRDRIAFRESEALAPERLLLAELLLAQDEPREAYHVAGLLQHPAPLIYLQFLPRSLAVRLRAAESLNRPDLAGEARRRLEALGWSGADRILPPSS